MKIRTSCPNNNKYYIRQVNGGWNGAIQGNPTKSGANVLANCVGYANGRFAEIQNKSKIKYQLVCNAENFIEKAKKYGLKVVSYPTLGGIMVWQKGSLSSEDGVGHVAIVERIDSKNQIYTSESCYRGSAFYNATRTNSNGRWGMSNAYKFRGCIINPAIGDKHYEEKKKEKKKENKKENKKDDVGRNTVGQTKVFKKTPTYIYKTANLSGDPYTYLKGTKVTVLKNVSKTVDYIQVPATKRKGYVNINVYK